MTTAMISALIVFAQAGLFPSFEGGVVPGTELPTLSADMQVQKVHSPGQTAAPYQAILSMEGDQAFTLELDGESVDLKVTGTQDTFCGTKIVNAEDSQEDISITLVDNSFNFCNPEKQDQAWEATVYHQKKPALELVGEPCPVYTFR